MAGSIMLDSKPIKTEMIRKGAYTIRQDGEKTVILKGHKIFITGLYEKEVWDMCDGNTTVEEIISKISKKHKKEKEFVTNQIINFLKRLLLNGLLIL